MEKRKTTTIEIATGDDHPVLADLYLPASGPPRGIVVLCHGFKAYRTWGFFPYIANCLTGNAIAALVMDFSHNGTLPAGNSKVANTPYTNPSLFRKNTISRERADLSAVISQIITDGLGGTIKSRTPLGLFGHSRGGTSVILNALDFSEVRSICTWSTPAHPDIFTAEQKRKWRDSGSFDFMEARHGIRLSTDVGFLNDIEEHYEEYRIENAVKRLRIPHMIVHGTLDIPIPYDSAIALHKAEAHSKQRHLVLVASGHTFGVTHPFEKPSKALVKVTGETVRWFLLTLSSEINTGMDESSPTRAFGE